jgi:sugar phosphate isomerase/epimerase
MPAQIALQLYSVREALARDFEGVVRQVAAMGFDGVEPAGYPGTTPEAAGELFRELGLLVPSAHVFPPPTGAKLDEARKTLDALDCQRLVSGLGPNEFKTMDDIKRSCALLNESNAGARARGLGFAVHNHWWEYEKVDGRYVYHVMLEELDPSVLFELDTYWIKTAGCDPAAVIREYGARAPLLHIKDGPAVKEEPMLALGTGVMDIPALLEAGTPHVEWLIIELDRTATDMIEAVRQSQKYLSSVNRR